jgi:hypothetical protein
MQYVTVRRVLVVAPAQLHALGCRGTELLVPRMATANLMKLLVLLNANARKHTWARAVAIVAHWTPTMISPVEVTIAVHVSETIRHSQTRLAAIARSRMLETHATCNAPCSGVKFVVVRANASSKQLVRYSWAFANAMLGLWGIHAPRIAQPTRLVLYVVDMVPAASICKTSALNAHVRTVGLATNVHHGSATPKVVSSISKLNNAHVHKERCAAPRKLGGWHL